ncbi:MAG: hypothetical protein KF730_05585 [Sphingomonas sp.]|uniref:hypothetical protein n=1 Tax=Sphingomonas sp. TaxID=28214 RepID=UPI0025FB9600|nr:hypothetical protein [Sphingomonas sp.]MBX3564033.1 hypothetical protein [Sphingomonas sp.]
MIKPQNDKEFGPFGEAFLLVLDLLFPKIYNKVLIIDPEFNDENSPNISPQFSKKDFFILSSHSPLNLTSSVKNNFHFFSESKDLDESIDFFKYENIILGSANLDVITAWAQSEYAIIAFREETLNDHLQWLDAMQKFGVVRDVP